MNFTIRTATLADADKITALFNDYRVFYAQASDMQLAHEFITQRLKNNESVVFYAEDGQGKALGFTELYPSFSSVSAQRCWILNDLFVSAKARRLGVAKQLMEAAKQFATDSQAKSINLETSADNLHAQALYESLGYEKINGVHFYSLNLKS